jgi:phosphoribosylglycinamide formyltransferase 1
VKRIAVFASGTGTNARLLIEHFKLHAQAQVTLLVCNKADAPALQMAREHGVETLLVNRETFYALDFVHELPNRGIDLVVLAGFLWLIPEQLVKHYANRMVNIHPSLLPKFGGKGMYGKYVHAAVLAAGETETGITIHYVSPEFDQGKQLAQFTCDVAKDDTVESLAARVQDLEHLYFAPLVESIL